MLGVVDNLMCDQLRERVFTDIGNPDLVDRVKEVIDKLHVDAQILTKENQDLIVETEHNFTKWDNKGPNGEKKLQSAVLEVDVNEHMGEADAEMVSMIEGSLKKVIDSKIDG